MALCNWLVSIKNKQGNYARLPIAEAEAMVSSGLANFVSLSEWRKNSTAAQRATIGARHSRMTAKKSGPRRAGGAH